MEDSDRSNSSMPQVSAQSVDFETAMRDLEAVVTQLDGEVKLEKALQLFEQGMKLSRQCEDFLKGAEQKIEMLKRGNDGALQAVPVVGDNMETAVAAARAVTETSSTPKKKKAGPADGSMVIAEHAEQLGLGLVSY